MKIDVCDNSLEHDVGIIMRQTDYDNDTAISKLNEFNMDIMLVIKDFMNIPEKPIGITKTINQRMFDEFRTFLDDASIAHSLKKEENEVKENKVIENEVIENEVIENEVIENEVIENEVIENEVIENEVIENEVV
jgi:hypothetical protein